jgi:hypothetical protein
MSSPIEIVNMDHETWFKIPDHDLMRPFLMNIVSDSNHWMFIASNGGLTAGRKNSRYSLFPYYTDDKLIDLAEVTGSKTIIKIEVDGDILLWEPFSEHCKGAFTTKKNLYKSLYGNKVMFEEVNQDLGLTFRYQWNSSSKYGFVRKAELENSSGKGYQITLLDGLQNVLPYGVDPDTQSNTSNLVDAYKRTELVGESGLGIFALSAIIVDKTEPSEALKANVVWSVGLDRPTHLLSSLQLDDFRKGQPVQAESDVKGEKGAYFVIKDIHLEAKTTQSWMIVANVNQNHSQIISLNNDIQTFADLDADIEQDIQVGTSALLQLVAGADGLRHSSDTLKDSRHFSNVLFNIMRGGTFDENYLIDKHDLLVYLSKANRSVFDAHQDLLRSLPENLDVVALGNILQDIDDADLYRLCKEYLPLKFSRRHGDPSRPWNQFSINTHNELDGSKILDYEGNWRDIFQNWEALAHSYPAFIEGMIFKFLNASTFDGYNPYRVTKDGFDWEIIEHDNPWSYIGYWGDHQIIYLLKFLEFYHSHQPKAIDALFSKDCFVYANVPYRIKSYADIAMDPKNTIDFDESLDKSIRESMTKLGSDGSLLNSSMGDIHHVNFMEKILATVLAKVSNFIPEGGIWMNTQRPEWNDANNALVGNGVSMVTLYYLRRFLKFFEEILNESSAQNFNVSTELHTFCDGISSTLSSNMGALKGPISDTVRKDITDALGMAGSEYRIHIYDKGFSGQMVSLEMSQLKEFVEKTLKFLEHSIEANRRDDHLYHSYNLMSFEKDGVSIDHLSEILEGQVAVLSSGYLSPLESADLLDSMRKSSLYRPDQNSYMLYPNKSLPKFLEKNTIPKQLVHSSKLLKQLVEDGDQRIVSRDINGDFHFNGNFRNAADLRKALDDIQDQPYRALAADEKSLVLQIFEDVFNHKAFTGRSGTFFAYEGLGSIYWHMVSKLHLAVMEVCQHAFKSGATEDVLKRLLKHFYEIGEGIGVHKSPNLYGAFPTDAYSHTPLHRGAQQPGMTGQVKEDILVSIGELGVVIEDGRIRFDPKLLRRSDFNSTGKSAEFVDVYQHTQMIEMPSDALAFTYCQVPIIYRKSDRDGVEVATQDGSTTTVDCLVLDEHHSGDVFNRTGKVTKIVVHLKDAHLN